MLKCAFHERDITPPLGCSIPGYFNLRLGKEIKDRLYAKGAVISSGGNTVALLAVDAIEVTEESCSRINAIIAEATGIPSENIMISATHTHTGGPRTPFNEMTADTEQSNPALDTQYLEMLRTEAAGAVIEAYKQLEDTSAYFGVEMLEGISFNRNYIMKDGSVKTNPGRLNPDIVRPYAGIDPEVSVLYFKNSEKKPVGAVINFACHQDCISGECYSGDFSSALSYELKKMYGKDFVSVFVPGTCGNINHFDTSRAEDAPDHYVMMGKTLAEKASSAMQNAQELDGCTVLSEKTCIALKKRVPSEEQISEAQKTVDTVIRRPGVSMVADSKSDQYALAMAKRLLSYAKDVTSPQEDFPVFVQAIRIGDMLIYGLPGEVFVQFGLQIKNGSPFSKNIIATLCNGSFGYIPTAEMFDTDIYEAKLGRTSCLEKHAGEKICKKELEIAKALACKA